MVEIPLAIFLLLVNFKPVFAPLDHACDVPRFVLSLLLVIWWVWHLKITASWRLLIEEGSSKLGPAVFKANCIESETPDLNLERL